MPSVPAYCKLSLQLHGRAASSQRPASRSCGVRRAGVRLDVATGFQAQASLLASWAASVLACWQGGTICPTTSMCTLFLHPQTE